MISLCPESDRVLVLYSNQLVLLDFGHYPEGGELLLVALMEGNGDFELFDKNSRFDKQFDFRCIT